MPRTQFPSLNNVDLLLSLGCELSDVSNEWFRDGPTYDSVVDDLKRECGKNGYELGSTGGTRDFKGVPTLQSRKPGANEWPSHDGFDVMVKELCGVDIPDSDGEEFLSAQVRRIKHQLWANKGKEAWDNNIDAMFLRWACGFPVEEVRTSNVALLRNFPWLLHTIRGYGYLEVPGETDL